MGKIDACFSFFAKGKIRTTILIAVNFTLSILMIVLTATQATVILSDDVRGIISEDAWKEDCQMVVINYISPFQFAIDGQYHQGCPWRGRNTAFRSVVSSFLFLASALGIVALYRNKYEWTWPVVYWSHWVLFVLFFVVFVLDADGLNSGYSSCRSQFEVDAGDGSTVQV